MTSDTKVLGFELKGYSTNPQQPVVVGEIAHHFLSICLPTAPAINLYIQNHAPTSPLTGEMIVSASDKFELGSNGIAVMVAICQDEGMLGCLGRAAKTKNAGNVGNDDQGHTREFATWQAGLDALAECLFKRKTSN